MKKTLLTVYVAIVAILALTTVSCTKEDQFNDFYNNLSVDNYVPLTKSMYNPEGGTDEHPFLTYSNCGLWGIAQMCGGADMGIYQGAVLSAAESSINWDEEANKNSLTKRGLKGEEILSVCNKMREINNAKKGLERLSGLDKNLPNTYEPDRAKALQVIEELKASSHGKKISGAMVGIETYDANGNLIDHWVPLEKFTENGEMVVRDQMTSQQYYDQEHSGQSWYSNRYITNKSVSQVKCILYRK